MILLKCPKSLPSWRVGRGGMALLRATCPGQDGQKTERGGAVMARSTSRPMFLVVNGPGPFYFISKWLHMLEEHNNHFEFELTVKPIGEGVTLLGHNQEFKIPFQVALMGATTKWGHGMDEPRNIRFLGRFLIPNNLQPQVINSMNAAPELNTWQWEAVFSLVTGSDVRGCVCKLKTPIPADMTF